MMTGDGAMSSFSYIRNLPPTGLGLSMRPYGGKIPNENDDIVPYLAGGEYFLCRHFVLVQIMLAMRKTIC